jgi:serine protease Do
MINSRSAEIHGALARPAPLSPPGIPTRISTMTSRIGSRLAAASVALALGTGLALTPGVMPRAEARQAIDLSDLAERVMDAVVNISTSSRVDAAPGQRPGPQGRRPGQPGAPGAPGGPGNPGPGAPFDELFEEFFRRRGENPPGGPNGQPAPQRRQSSLGSGFVIDASGIVVTNNHVIDNADEITVIFNDGTRLKAGN